MAFTHHDDSVTVVGPVDHGVDGIGTRCDFNNLNRPVALFRGLPGASHDCFTNWRGIFRAGVIICDHTEIRSLSGTGPNRSALGGRRAPPGTPDNPKRTFRTFPGGPSLGRKRVYHSCI